MKFGPQNKDEAVIFALEELRADIQYEILRRMKQLGLSQAALAKKIGVSAAWVSQILDDDANLTLESISKVFLALESKCHVAALPLESTYYEALWGRVEVEEWNEFRIVDASGYPEGVADFSRAVISSRRTERPTLVPRTTKKADRDIVRCLEVA